LIFVLPQTVIKFLYLVNFDQFWGTTFGKDLVLVVFGKWPFFRGLFALSILEFFAGLLCSFFMFDLKQNIQKTLNFKQEEPQFKVRNAQALWKRVRALRSCEEI